MKRIIMLMIKDQRGYIDAATGSMIMMMLVGGFSSMLVLLKIYWKRVKGFVKRKLGKGDEEDANTTE